MLLHPQAIVLLLAGITTPATSQTPPSLINALVASGASQFASIIQSDSEVLSLYLSDRVTTVFAPIDSCVGDSPLQERDLSASQRRAAAFQSARGTTTLETASRSLPGSSLETNDEAPLLDGRGQRIVIDTRPLNATSPTKRWASSAILRRQVNGTAQSLLRISSGLGKTTNVIKGDIPYDGGIIHITDSYFTMPQSLSATSQATGQTAFAQQLSLSNTTSTLDTTHSVTVFLPSNAAFSSFPNSTAPQQLVSDHVVPGTVSYLPDLRDGSVLTTQRGETLAISVRAGRYYVNGGLITQANLVLENGVAHVVDRVSLCLTTTYSYSIAAVI